MIIRGWLIEGFFEILSKSRLKCFRKILHTKKSFKMRLTKTKWKNQRPFSSAFRLLFPFLLPFLSLLSSFIIFFLLSWEFPFLSLPLLLLLLLWIHQIAVVSPRFHQVAPCRPFRPHLPPPRPQGLSPRSAFLSLTASWESRRIFWNALNGRQLNRLKSL